MQNRPQIPEDTRRRMLVVFITGALLACGLAGLLIPIAAGGGLDLLVDDTLDAVLRAVPPGMDIIDIVGYFLLVEGALWVLGGLIYIVRRVSRVGESPEGQELQEVMRANLSAREALAAQQALASLAQRVWIRGLIFLALGFGSLVVAAVLLSGLLG